MQPMVTQCRDSLQSIKDAGLDKAAVGGLVGVYLMQAGCNASQIKAGLSGGLM